MTMTVDIPEYIDALEHETLKGPQCSSRFKTMQKERAVHLPCRRDFVILHRINRIGLRV